MRKDRQLLLEWYGEMLEAYESRLSRTDRLDLARWEREHFGVLSTSDWPGWEKFIGKRPQELDVTPMRRTA